MENIELKKLKINAIIIIIMFLLNILIISYIYITISTNEDLNELNKYSNNINILNEKYIIENKTIFNLNQSKNKYEALLNEIKSELDDIIYTNNNSNREIEKLQVQLKNIQESNIKLESQILELEVQVK